MDEDKYSDFVWSRTKDGLAIIEGMNPTAAEFLHAAIGVSGEAGELLDAIKKYVIYGKPLDRANVIEELGDIEFYLQMMRTALRIEHHEIIEANVSKLSKRYPQGYTDRDAIERKDKQDER
jgi:NTP pyrophosphatase (non-canonical NTP hydrolase)